MHYCIHDVSLILTNRYYSLLGISGIADSAKSGRGICPDVRGLLCFQQARIYFHELNPVELKNYIKIIIIVK